MSQRTPYTNFHNLNLDWVIKKIKTVFSPDNPPPYPVISVNEMQGAVKVTAQNIPYVQGQPEMIWDEVNKRYIKPQTGIPGTDLAESYLKEPATPGTIGQVLTSDGQGNQSWETPSAGGSEWELIGEYTVPEDTVQFNITTDSNGESFELSEMLARVWFEASTTGARDYMSASNIVKNTSDIVVSVVCPTKRYITNAGNAFFAQYQSKIVCGLSFTQSIAASNPGSIATVEQIQTPGDNVKSYIGFRLQQYSNTTSLVPKDTVVKLYGIRK